MHQAEARVRLINPEVRFHPVNTYLDESNAQGLIKGADVVMDALDQIPVRFTLQEACEKEQIPMVYGAIAGWYGQIATIIPGDRTLDHIYPNFSKQKMDRGVETDLGNPSFTPALAASVQVSECLKVLTGSGELLRKKMLYVDLLDNEMMIVPIKSKI